MSRLLTGTFIVAALVVMLSFTAPAQAQFCCSTPTVVYRPVVTTYVEPTTVYYAGPVVAPAPVVVGPAYAPVPITTTRYRPILGGTVTRTRYYYAPTTVFAPVW